MNIICSTDIQFLNHVRTLIGADILTMDALLHIQQMQTDILNDVATR